MDNPTIRSWDTGTCTSASGAVAGGPSSATVNAQAFHVIVVATDEMRLLKNESIPIKCGSNLRKGKELIAYLMR